MTSGVADNGCITVDSLIVHFFIVEQHTQMKAK